MKCRACKRQARGYDHTDNHHGMGDPQRYSIDWVFCSRHCQDASHVLYGNWQRVEEGHIDKTEVVMIDPSDVELAAACHRLKAFGEVAGEIGFTEPLGDYSEAEALRATNVIVTCWSDAMVAHHESSKFPPARDLPPTPNSLAPNTANPFADLEDDLPWEEPKGKKP